MTTLLANIININNYEAIYCLLRPTITLSSCVLFVYHYDYIKEPNMLKKFSKLVIHDDNG